MKTKAFNRILWLLVVFAFVMGTLNVSASNLSTELEFNTSRDRLSLIEAELLMEIPDLRPIEGRRLLSVFDERIAELQAALAEYDCEIAEVGLSIYRIEGLSDFAGNQYTLVELHPFGYMIYHNDSGIFVERSPTSLSPFAGLYDETLYYGGFTNYLYGTDDGFVCVVSEEIVEADVAEEYNWAGFSGGVADYFLDVADYAVLDYVEHGFMSVQTMSNGMPSAWTNVADWGFVQRQTVSQTGANKPNEGHCGFVALAILIGYFDHVPANRGMEIINGGLTPRRVTNRHTATALVQANFVEDLRVVGDIIGVGRQAINITEARNVARRYFQDRGVWNRISDILDTTALTTTNNRIRNNISANRPVYLSSEGLPGTSGKIGGHAVVGYGTRTEGNGSFTVRVNYGWGNAHTISGGHAVGTHNATDVWITGFSWNGMLTFSITP